MLKKENLEQIIIYVRVSTDEQKDQGHSIEEQISILEEMVRKGHNLEKSEVLVINDAGYSANNPKRPGYTKLKELVREKEVDYLYVTKLDRLNRDLMEGFTFLLEATQSEVTIVLPTEIINLQIPEKELSVIIRLIFAYFESRMASVRTKSGMAGGLKKGLYSLGGQVPFGFKRTENNVIVKDEEKQHIVKNIIDDYIQTPLSINQIALKYELAYRTVDNILMSDIYKGIIKYDEQEYVADEQPYINTEIEKAIKTKKQIYAKKNKYIYLFKNKLYCSKCFSVLKQKCTVKTNETYLYYRCENKDCLDYKKQINEVKAISLLNTFTDKCLIYNTRFDKVADNNIIEQISIICKRIEILKKQEKKNLEKLLNYQISEEEYDLRKDEIKTKSLKEEKKLNDMISNMNYNKYLKSKIYEEHLSDFLIDLTKQTIQEFTTSKKIEKNIEMAQKYK